MSTITIDLPYGKDGFLEVEIPQKNLIGIVEPKDVPGVKDEEEAIRHAIRNPIHSKPLSEIAKSGDKVAIVVDDNTRRCPDDKIVPILLDELGDAGVRDEDITIVVALGTHRPLTEDELKARVGEEAFERVKVINHDCYDKTNAVYYGITKRLKTPLWVNKAVAKADVKITTGIVEFHTFAGYSGGRKSIMPGVSSVESILAVHQPYLIDNPNVGIGVLEGNIIHEDMVDAARLVGVDFIVNVVLNSKNEIVKVAAGDVERAHEELINVYDQIYRVEITEPADIVISSPGYPKDINLYQATRAGNNIALVPKPSVKRGGLIIIPAPCQDGVGDELFYKWMKTAKSPEEVIQRGLKGCKELCHKPYILSKILVHAGVIMTNCEVPDKIIREMHMMSASTVEDGLKMALDKMGSDAKILVVKHSISTMPVLK